MSGIHTAVRIAVVLMLGTGILFGQGTTITVLHVNDTHSHLESIGPKNEDLTGTLGGIARAATVIGTVRATEPNVLLLHAGDVFQGDLFFNTYFGVPELQILKELGCDAMTVGNHEFDFGPGVLNDVITTAFAGGSFPLISANLDMDGFPALETWIHPAIMKVVDGKKIGIFGMTVPGNATNMPDPVVIREEVVTIVQETTDSLRAEGANAVILLSHLGIYLDRLVASSTTGVNFIIGGHDHYLFEEPVVVLNPSDQEVPIFQAGEHYKNIGKLTFTIDGGTVTIDHYGMLTVDESVPAVPEIQGIIDDLKTGIEAQFGPMYTEVVGVAPTEIAKRIDPRGPQRDTPMGNLVTDAFRAKTGTDLAITALGLISEKIYKGPIVGADIFRSMSYGFDEATGYGLGIATFDITGPELIKGMEIGLSQLEIGDDFFLQYSGLRFRYDPAKPVGQRVDIGSIHVGNREFSPYDTYSVTVNTGIVMLLSQLGVVVDNLQILDDFEFDVVRDYIEAMGVVAVRSDGRIREHIGRGGDAAIAAAGNNNISVNAYPNPFNPSTKIWFTLDRAGHTAVKVYNTIGQEIATLLDGDLTSGNHVYPWNAGDLPGGIYFCRLTGPGFNKVIKLLLMK